MKYFSIGYWWNLSTGRERLYGNLLMVFDHYPTEEEMIEKVCSETNAKDYNTEIHSLSEISKEWYEVLTKG